MFGFIRTSIVAGLLAAVGSGVGKLSFDGDNAMTKTLTVALEKRCVGFYLVAPSQTLPHISIDNDSSGTPAASTRLCQNVGYIIRGCFAVLMLMLNGTMLGLYVRAMQEEGSVVATVINMASSFLGTGLLGYFLFEEQLKPLWFLGATLMASGVYLVAQAAPNSMVNVPGKDNIGNAVPMSKKLT